MDNNEKINFEYETENLDEQFNDACAQLKALNLKLDNDTKLKFYGLFKSATVGKSSENTKMISFFDFEEKYKFEAWKKCDILTKQEAKKNYIHLFREIVNKNIKGDQVNESDSIKISDFTNSAVYSSTANETKRELESHFNNLQEKEKKFFLLSNKFYKGETITENSLRNENVDLLNCRDNIGQTILHTAVDSGNLSAVETLINLGIAKQLINIQDNQKMTAMHIASINYEEPMFSILATLKPDKTITDEEGKTFIDYLNENDDLEDNLQKLLKLF